MASAHDWTRVQPEKKWLILSKLKRFSLWALYTSVGSMMLGFDFGIAGTATAMPAFQKVMGIPYPSAPSGYLIPANVQSGWSGVSTAGEVVGVLISGWAMDRIGRKNTLMLGSIFTSIGIAMQIASRDWQLFLGGRLVNAIGFGVVFVFSPVWIGENVRPELRGLSLCIVNGSIVLGQFLLSLIAYGTAQIEGTWSYQSIVVLQFAFVLVLVVGFFFFPESPYHLLNTNREEEARKSLLRMHGSSDIGLIDAEMDRLKDMIKTSKTLDALASTDGSPLIQCFKGVNLKRTLISILPPAAQQFIGAAFVLGYITYFMSLLGIESFFTVSVVLYVVMLLSNIAAFPLIETAGRRPLLLYGIISLTLIELLMGIMGFVQTSGALWVILVCIFLWAIAYQVSIGAVGFAIASEVSSPPLRPATLSIVGMTQGITGWIIGFISPYMINPDAGNLGAKVGLVFFGLGLPLCVLFYFFIPETKGLTFDDMDYLFAEKVATRHFQTVIRDRRQQIAAETSGESEIKVVEATVSEVEHPVSNEV
ncbi:general substrate transporter [Thozetella sp. PMI_491]|nr:general substrate transporter [Thozetella sp. PMI_491]